ncbi:MYBPC1 [Mytilus coruscus]|uniref:MYBPC1 n=1 Tax=Mytilus coruscus TaxID=42192 RepID=A0A6J8C0K8_MYTCO|nr:MYBPC1 [Mytilus coruscus]
MLDIGAFFATDLTIDPTKQIEGNTISISCEIKQKNITAIWYKDEGVITLTDRIKYKVIESKHILTINQADLSDSAVYWIDFGVVKRHIKLEVEDYFSKALSIDPRGPIEGNDISISCEIKQKNVSGMWYKNESLLTTTGKIKYDVIERKHRLMITKADLSDSAVYCISFGGLKRQIKLEIEDFFSKALTIDPTEPIEGNDISINCEVKKKNISSVWYKNGSPVSSTEKIKCDKNDRKHTLKITTAALTDSAVYCIDFEGVKRQIDLHVEGVNYTMVGTPYYGVRIDKPVYIFA